MKQIKIIHPGVTLKTSTNTLQYNQYTLALTNFQILIYQTHPFKYLNSIYCPKDIKQLQNDQYLEESSGFACFDIDQQGRLAVISQASNLYIYNLKDFCDNYQNSYQVTQQSQQYNIQEPIQKPLSTLNVSITKDGKIDTVIDRVQGSHCYYNCIQWCKSDNPQFNNVLCAFNCIGKNIIFINSQTNKVFSINFDIQVNLIKQITSNDLLIGTSVNGKLFSIKNLQTIINYLQEKQITKLQVDLQQIAFDQRSELMQLELKKPIDQQTIWTTPFLHWQNIWFPTCLSCDVQNQLILTVWSGGFIFLHLFESGSGSDVNSGNNIGNNDSNNTNKGSNNSDNKGTKNDNNKGNNTQNITTIKYLSTIHLKDITCGCWISNGLMAFGTKSGFIQIVSLQSILSQNEMFKKNQDLLYKDLQIKTQMKFPLLQGESQEIELEKYLFYSDKKVFDKDQVSQQIHLPTDKQIVTIKSLKKIITVTTSEGQVLIYNCNQNSLLFKQTQNHQQTILGIEKHPTLSDTFITVSGDSTAKVYKNFECQASFGTTQIITVVQDKFQDDEDSFGGFISVAWDTRERSAICAIGTITGSLLIVDVYRNKIYKIFKIAKGRVFGLSWVQNTIIATTEDGGIFYIDADKLTCQLLTQLDNQIRGCDICPRDKMLGCTGYDGYARIFVLVNDKYEQVGKFAVTKDPLYQIKFHPTLTQTLAISSDDGSVKIYRYDNSNNNFKVQCVSTLKNSEHKARVIQFNEALPNILVVGKWCGEVDVFDWVQNKLLYTFKSQQDIYGIEFNKDYPLEMIISGRDVNIRKIYLSDLAEKTMLQTVLASLDSACCQLNIQSKAQYFRQQEEIKQIFLTQLKTLIKRPSYSYMKNNPNIQILAEQCFDDIISKCENQKLFQILSALLDKFSYQDSGYKELLNYSNYWITRFNDITDPYQQYIDNIDEDNQFYIEYPLSNGLCLSSRALRYAAKQLGRHYYNAIYGENQYSKVDPKFNQQKYKFFEFQRELPQDKKEAMKLQTKHSILLLACSGDIINTKMALKQEKSQLAAWFGSSEQIFQEEQSNLELSEIETKILKAVGYWSQTNDFKLINDIINEIQQNYPQMLTYALILQNLSQQDQNVEKSEALNNLKSNKIIKAGMFYITQQDYNSFETVMELYDNSTLSSLIFLNCGLCEKQFNKLALKSSLHHIKFEGLQNISQNKQYWLLNNYMSQYTQKFKQMRKEGVKEQNQFNINAIQQQIDNIVQYNLNKFEAWILNCQQPDNFTYILSQMQGNSIQIQYKQAICYIIKQVNYYVQKQLQQNREIEKLNSLYMQFTIRNLDYTDKSILSAHILNVLIVIKQNMKKQLFKLVIKQTQNLLYYISKINQENIPEILSIEGFRVQDIKQIKYYAMWQLNLGQKDKLLQALNNKDIQKEIIGLENEQFIKFVDSLDDTITINSGIYI